MKKILATVLFLSSLLMLFSACGLRGQTDCSALLKELTALYPDMPASDSVYLSGKAEGEQGFLSETDASFIYTGVYGTLPEWELIDSYAIRLPDRPQVYEIHIVKVKNETDADTVCKMMCHRADLLHKYFLAQTEGGDYDYSRYQAEIYSKGSYIFLLATPDNEVAKKCIEKKI